MIEVRELTVRQGAFSLEGLSFTVPAGEYAVLMGKSGSGKTTTLEAVAGLRTVAGGTIRLAGLDCTARPPAARGIGYVPQDGALFDTMTVRANLGFALELRGEDPTRRAAELAEQLELAPLLERMPKGLSGGERQRVALGRALAYRPPVLLLDEPLGALDDDTRDQLIGMLLKLKRETTVLHVTHNRSEAERLADRVLRLDSGRLVDH
ncbi:MAG: ABC transporter ATP-binding protein [Gemmataceae bacterium]